MRSTELDYLYDEDRMNKRRGAREFARVLGEEAHRTTLLRYRSFRETFGETFERRDLQEAFDDGDARERRRMVYLEGAAARFRDIQRASPYPHGIEKETWEEGWDHFDALTDLEKCRAAYIMGLLD